MLKHLLTFITISSFSLFSSIQTAEDHRSQPTLSVRGEAVLYKPADQMEITVGVVTRDPNSEKALQLNNEKMEKVIRNLQQVGLDKSDYKTGRFYIHPIYQTPPKNPSPDWHPAINSYEVNNSIVIKTTKLDLAPKIIEAASQGGSNQIDHIQFNLKDPRSYREEAVELATNNAVSDAQVLAKAAHINLAGVSSISLDQAQPVYPVARQMMFAAKEFSGSTPIEAGDVEVRAAVNIEFFIKPDNSSVK